MTHFTSGGADEQAHTRAETKTTLLHLRLLRRTIIIPGLHHLMHIRSVTWVRRIDK